MAPRKGGIEDLRNTLTSLVSLLEQNTDPAVAKYFEGVLNNLVGSPKKADALREAAKGPTAIQRQIDDAGGITMGSRSVPSMRDLGAAPRPEFGPEALEVLEASGQKVPATLQMLRKARERLAAPTSAEYNYQPSLGLRFPAGARAITEYLTSRGAVRQPGTGLGGQPYNPMAMASPDNIDVIRGANTMRLPDLDDLPDAPARIPQGQLDAPLDFRSNREVMSEQPLMAAPRVTAPGAGGGRGVTSSTETIEFDPGALVRSPGGQIRDPMRPMVTQDPMRPRGVQVVDLDEAFRKSKLPLEFSMDPRQRLIVGATGAIASLPLVAQVLRGQQPMSQEPSEMFGPPDQAPDAGDGEFGGGSLPPGTGVATPPPETTLTPEQAGALNQNQEEILTTLQQSDPASSAAIRAVAPKSPENYANIGDYYRDRAIFVKSLKDGTFQRIVDAIKADAGANAENLGTWAEANRNLAYDYAVRNQLVPELTQQTGESVATMGVGSALGDNNDASAVGMANAEADNVGAAMGVGGDLERAAAIQKNNEIISATQPIARPNLQRSQDLVQQYLMRRRGF